MNIDQYLVDGEYSYNGANYESAEDLIHIGICGFCGCGAPDESLRFIQTALQHIQDMKDRVWPDNESQSKITWEQWNEEGKAKLGAGEYFIYYWLDEKGLTEHGGSVPGWLTQEGIEMLEDLNELLK